MPPRRTLALLALSLAAAAPAAHAQPVTYTFEGIFDQGSGQPKSIAFVVQTATPITAAGSFPTTSCAFVGDPGDACEALQDFDPNGFSTGFSFINARYTTGSRFYFFAAGSFLANGVYAAEQGALAGTDPTTGDPALYGSAGPATLTVSGIGAAAVVPEPATVALFGAGLAVLTGAAVGRRRLTVRT